MEAILACDRRRRVLLTIALAAAVALGASGSAFAAGSYVSGTSGYDISWPQCGGAYPPGPYAFGIVGVTGGRAFYHNACLADEFHWATAGSTAPSLYMNLNYAIGTTASNGLSGPKGDCSRRDKACQAYNYGYNAALDAATYGASVGATATTWWLDIETGNSWSRDKTLNAMVIQGAIDYLGTLGTVGIYSTAYQWGVIAGSFSPGLPNWVAGAPSRDAAPAYCADTSKAFAGGQAWLVQYPNGSFDGDYAC